MRDLMTINHTEARERLAVTIERLGFTREAVYMRLNGRTSLEFRNKEMFFTASINVRENLNVPINNHVSYSASVSIGTYNANQSEFLKFMTMANRLAQRLDSIMGTIETFPPVILYTTEGS